MRRLLDLAGRFLNLRQVHRLVRALLRSQGIGAGAGVDGSGEVHVIERLLRPLQHAPVVLDVGANVGDYARAVRKVRTDARVFCFEPSPHAFAKLTSALGGAEGVTLLPFALAAESGPATLYSDASGSGLASMTRRRLDHYGIAITGSEAIVARTLDDVLDSVGSPFVDLMKLDVEGHELDVLRGGARAMAARRISAVQFEFGGTDIDTRVFLQDFFYLFKEHDYQLYIVAPGRLVRVDGYSELLEQFVATNYLALSRQAPPAR